MDAEWRLLLHLLKAELGAESAILPWIDALISGALAITPEALAEAIIAWARAYRPDLLVQIERLVRILLRLPATALEAEEAAVVISREAAARELARKLALRAGLGAGEGVGGVFALAALPVLLLFFAGILLPAWHMGELEFDNPFTRAKRRRAAVALIRDLVIAHSRQREAYARQPSAAALRELH